MRLVWHAVALAAFAALLRPGALRADEAEQAFEILYGREFRRVQATHEKTDDLALARQILTSARSASPQPALLAVLCDRTYALAGGFAEGCQTAIEALDLLAEKVPARKKECDEKKVDLYQRQFQASHGADRAVAGEQLIACLMVVAAQAADGGDYATGAAYLRRASYLATALRSRSAAIVQAGLTRLTALERTQKQIDLLAKRLEAEPTDAELREQLIRLHLVEQDDAAAAARLLDASCSERYRTYVPLVSRDVASLADTACLELGDWFLSLSAGASEIGQASALGRAKRYYEAFLDKHPAGDLARTRATLALQKVGESLAKLAPLVPAAGPAVRPGAKSGAALSALALVTRPGAIDGVAAWTMETSQPRGGLNCLTFSPDGQAIALAGETGTIRILDARTGRGLRVLVGHDRRVNDLAFSPDGRALASASDDQSVRLWDSVSGRLLKTLGDQADVSGLAWAPDGKSLATARSDAVVGLWTILTGKLRGVLGIHTPGVDVKSVAWSPNGRWIAFAGSGIHAGVWVWDARTGRRLRAVDRSTPDDMAWSPDSKLLALAINTYGGSYGSVSIWNAATGTVTQTLASVKREPRRALAWSPDGKHLAWQGDSGTVEVYQVTTWKSALALKAMVQGALSDVAWSPKGDIIAACGTSAAAGGDARSSHTLLVAQAWNAATGQVLWTVERDLPRLAAMDCSPEAARIAWGNDDWPGRIGICDLRTASLIDLWPHKGPVQRLSWSPDGAGLAAGIGSYYTGTSLNLWSARTGTQLQEFPIRDMLQGVAWSPGGATIAARGMKQLRLYDPKTGAVALALEAADLPLAWSPDGKWLAFLQEDKSIAVWDPASQKVARKIQTPSEVTLALAWAPEGTRLASIDADSKLWVWNLSTGRALHSLTCPQPVNSVVWSPDGKYIAVGQGRVAVPRIRPRLRLQADTRRVPGVVRIWDSRTGQEVKALAGHPCGLVGLAWRRRGGDSPVLVSAGERLIRLWDSESARPLLTIVPLGNAGSIALSPEGHFCPSPAIEADKDIVYIAQTATGEETFSPAEFAKRYGWKNDRGKVGWGLAGGSSATQPASQPASQPATRPATRPASRPATP